MKTIFTWVDNFSSLSLSLSLLQEAQIESPIS